MMTLSEMAEIVSRITYKPGWSIFFQTDESGKPYVQVGVSELAGSSADPFTGHRQAWKGGKHFLSVHGCRQEVVGTVFGAIRAAEEHEMREWFFYNNTAIYNPHLDPDKLVEFARKRENLNVRDDVLMMRTEPA